MAEPGAHCPSVISSTMPALLERPKLSNAMARALHRHIMMERERKRQGEPGPEREDRHTAQGGSATQELGPIHGPSCVRLLARLRGRPRLLQGVSEEAPSKFQNPGLGRTLEST